MEIKMPEGPECRQYAEALAKRVSGRKLVGIDILSGRYSDKHPTGMEEILHEMPIQVVGAGVHGKFVYIILQDEWSLWNTLGMTGSWSDTPRAHPRVRLTLDNGDIYFNDDRNFGTLKFVKGKFQLIQKLKSLGPDILAEDITDGEFILRFRKNNDWQITTAMMNQSVVAGIGNYIKAEALWLARISPHRRVSELSDGQLSLLYSSINSIMKESYKTGGTTINSYEKIDKADNTDDDFSRRFLVYNQKTDPDGNKVVRETTEDQRTTHWCPGIQV